jgi:Spy/CpxP family protein refolding chaperone
MNRLKLAAGVILILIVGVLAGSLGTGIYYKKRVERFESGGLPVSERVGMVLGRFSQDLKLTDEQRAEFEKIIKESQEELMTLGRSIFPEIEKINEKTFASMKEKLTDEQKNELEVLIQKMQDVRKRFENGQLHQRMPYQKPWPQHLPQQAPQQGTPGQAPQQAGTEQAPLQKTPESYFFREYDMRFIGMLKERLNLSKEQEAKVSSIMEEGSREREKVFKKYWTDLAEIEKSLENSLSSILSKEQMEKYRADKEMWSFGMPRPQETP